MLPHLLECRHRLLLIFGLFAVLFMAFFCISESLFQALIRPLLQVLPTGDTLIATHITTALLTPIQLAADVALLSTTPYALWHAWQFAAPGLYRKERKRLRTTIVVSLVLFFLGLLFCFYWVLPCMFAFFAHAVPTGVRLMPDMGYAIDFITRMLLTFGLCFQVPLLCMLSVHVKCVDIRTLNSIRPYIYVLAFTLGMILTPPDVLSQIMLALPLCLLYEVGIGLARIG
ncbi:MAG TPA: twin-arginine translocase subunit TatC [Legionella sp.]|nr:twin-arginine translocase subunit TatC [Legionella sp.]